MLASQHAKGGMVFYLQESPKNKAGRRLAMDHCWLEGRDEEQHPTGQGGGPMALHHEGNAASGAEAGHRFAGSFQWI